MKSFGGIDSTNISRLSLPHGTALPRNPQQGEIFWLTADEKQTNTVTPWHPRGVYYFNYGTWFQLNHDGRQTKSSLIGSQLVEVEKAIRLLEQPTYGHGTTLTSVVINPSNARAGIAGMASLWLEPQVDAQVVLTAWRDRRMVGMAVDYVQAMRPRTMSLSFYDLPLSGYAGVVTQDTKVIYELQLTADKVTSIAVNRGHDQFVYDEVAGQTAFTVRETS